MQYNGKSAGCSKAKTGRDNSFSHVTVNKWNICDVLPLQSAHLTQFFDVAFFRPIKRVLSVLKETADGSETLSLKNRIYELL